jgi:undecaprenyl-diphosphatase
VKGGVMMALVWWAWFCRGGGREAVERRGRIVATFAAAAVALAIASAIEWLFPFRPRPIHDPALALHPPIGVPSDVMSDWSSFPSDHATLFIALATGLVFVSRPLGLAACAYAAFVILLPRVYLGWHYPSDVVAGAAIGSACTTAAQRRTIRDRLAMPVLDWARGHPQAFHALFFLVSYQVATLMDDSRVLARVALRLVRGQLS